MIWSCFKLRADILLLSNIFETNISDSDISEIAIPNSSVCALK